MSAPEAVETRRVASTDGVEIALHCFGGHGPPLIICHATGFHGRAYQPLARHLTDRFTVWAIDFRGHGASTEPQSGDYAWQGMSEDLAACVDMIGNPSVTAIGHSLGGASILLLELSQPGAVEAAYLFEPIVFDAGFVLSRRENVMSAAARRRRAVFESREAALERYAARRPLDELDPEALRLYVEHGFVDTDDGRVTLACTPEAEARTFEAEDKMTLDRIMGLSLRAAVAAGAPEEEPGPGPARLAPAIAEAIDGAVLLPHPELGHFGPLEAPAAIAADFLAWLG